MRARLTQVFSQSMASADDPDVVAKVVLKAASAARPKLRYPAGVAAGRLSLLRAFAPAGILDAGIRKNLQLNN